MARRVRTRVSFSNQRLAKPLAEIIPPKETTPPPDLPENRETTPPPDLPENRETTLPPDLPEKWLIQIKDALKQDNKRIFWTTVAGSSVIAALLGVIANFALESYKARLNHRLETHKVELQQQNKVRNETYEAYSAVSLQLERFSERLDDYVGVCKIAAEHPEEKKFSEWAQQAWGSLADQIGDLTQAKNHNKVDKVIAQEADKITGPIMKNLNEVQESPDKNPTLVQKHGEIKSAISELQNRIEDLKKNLTLTSPQ